MSSMSVSSAAARMPQAWWRQRTRSSLQAPNARSSWHPLQRVTASFGEVTVERAIRWWPAVGVLAMLMLGCAVGKGPTAVDEGFARCARELVGGLPNRLLVLTEWWLLGPVLALSVAAALCRRRWRLAVVMAAFPFVAIELNEAAKRLFERHKGSVLAYPSGHTTLVVVVMGMVVLVAGGRLWAVVTAGTVSVLGMFGLASTFHYVTDTIGAALLSTAMICVAARVAGCVPSSRGSPLVDTGPRKDADV